MSSKKERNKVDDPQLKEWAEVLLTATNNPDEVPEGWLRSADLAAMFKVSRGVVCDRVARGIEAGLIEKKNFRVGNPAKSTPHYKIKSDAALKNKR